MIEQPRPRFLVQELQNDPRMRALYLLVSLVCLHLHPWHSQVEAEINRGNRLGTQQSWKSEQTKLLDGPKQLYVDGDFKYFCAFHSSNTYKLQETLEVTLIQEVNHSLSRR